MSCLIIVSYYIALLYIDLRYIVSRDMDSSSDDYDDNLDNPLRNLSPINKLDSVKLVLKKLTPGYFPSWTERIIEIDKKLKDLLQSKDTFNIPQWEELINEKVQSINQMDEY